MEPAIRIDISPADHPDNVRGKYIEQHKEILHIARHAMEGMYTVRGRINDVAAKVQDKGLLAREAQAVGEKAMRRADEQLARLHARRDEINKQIESTIRPSTTDPAAPEIRAYFARNNAGVHTLASKGDVRSIAAILAAPAYLSGLDDKGQAALERNARLSVCRDQQGLLDDLDQAIEKVSASVRRFQQALCEQLKNWKDRDADIIKQELTNG